MAQLLSWQEVGLGGVPGGSIVEDLKDFVENVSAKDRPALAMFNKVAVRTAYIEWLEDTLPARGPNAQVEGQAAEDPDLTTPTRINAPIQIFGRWGTVSDLQRKVEHAGFADAMLYQEKKAIDSTLNDIEHTIHRGTKVTGASGTGRQFNGLLNIFSTNFTSSSGTTLTEEVFNDLVQLFVDNGTEIRPTVTFVNSWLKRTISLYSTKVTRNVDAAARVQELVVEQHRSDFGDINVFYSRDQLRSASKTASGNSIIILDPSFFETGWLQSLQSEVLARNGLRTQFQISAMLTLIYRTEKAGGGGDGYVANI